MRNRLRKRGLLRKVTAFFVMLSMLFSDTAPIFTSAVHAEDKLEIVCGLEEHVHDDSCYEDGLICGSEEAIYRNTFSVHHHTEACRNEAGEIVCGYAEDEYIHSHNEFCRNADGKLVCGLEARKPHEHTGECYRTDRILVCGNTDQGHTHTAECYTDRKEITCGLEEKEGHQHTDACYTARQVQICDETEESGHTHTDSCFETVYDLTCNREEEPGHQHNESCCTVYHDLTCGQEERPAHTHGDSCYEEVQTLVCNKPSGKHKHTDECFDGQGRCVCGRIEIPVFESTEANWKIHTHTESCYGKKLICGKKEHQHSDACLSGYSAEEKSQSAGTEEPDQDQENEQMDLPATEEGIKTDAAEQPEEKNQRDAAAQSDENIQPDAVEQSDEKTQPDVAEWPDQKEHEENDPQPSDPAGSDKKGNDSEPEESENQGKQDLSSPSVEIEETSQDETEEVSEVTVDFDLSVEDDPEISEEYIIDEEEPEIVESVTEEIKNAVYGENAKEDKPEIADSETVKGEITNAPESVASEEEEPELISSETRDENKKEADEGKTEEEVKSEIVGSVAEEEVTNSDDIKSQYASEEETEVDENKEMVKPEAIATDQATEISYSKNHAQEPEKYSDSENKAEPAPGSMKGQSQPEENIPGEENQEAAAEPYAEATEVQELAEDTELKDPENLPEGTESGDEETAEEAEAAEPEKAETEDEENEQEESEPGEKQISEEPGVSESGEEVISEEPEASEPGEETEADNRTFTIATEEDSPLQVIVTFNAAAGIPEATELIVADSGTAQDSSAAEKRSAVKRGAKMMNSAENREFPAADIPLTEWQAGEEAPEIQLYHRSLDISLVSDGTEIEPEAEVTVTVVLPDLEEGLDVTVRHQTERGLITLESVTDGQQVTFTTDSFSIFDFTSTAQKITSWTSDWLENTLYGRSDDQNVNHGTISIDEDSIPDGFSIIDTTSTTQNSNLWITLQRVKDIVLGKLESISLYAVENGRITALVKENVGLSDILRLNLGNYSSFALVRDSGLRSRIEELGNVVLSGLMPKNGVAEATDVTEEYENFLGGRSVSKEGEADEDMGGEGSFEGREADGETHTIAAFDITITNDGEEYQPEENPVTVTIQDEAIATAVANGNALTLWHLIDENNAERVENFTIDGDTVTFDASGFSVYIITETTIEKILTAADGNVYRITVTYDGSAQIPEGVELVVNEVDEGEYLSSTAAALGIDEDYLLYRKFLDISFKTTDENGDERIIEPATPVKVQIELLDVDAGADKLQVVHFGVDGAEKVAATATDNAVVSFTSDEFSVYGIGNVLEPIDTVETEEAHIELLGFGTEAQLSATDAPEVEEGLEVLGAYNVSDKDKIWIRAELKEDVELSSMESVAIYSMMDSTGEDETAGKTVEELATTGTITELTSTEFAVIKDTGYRHLSFNITPDEADEEKTVTLDGMMPKNAEAIAADVTENYTDHEFVESASINNEETPSVDGEENDKTAPVDDEAADEAEEEEQQESSGEDHTTSRVTLAAFDISITAGDQDYQPDETHQVTVTITDERILSGDHNLELWHIRDDGSQERIIDFTVENSTLSFEALGFSVYAVVTHENGTVANPRVMFHFIADGATTASDGSNAYYLGSPYTFKNKHGEIQTSQILSNGESLELITDPGNQQDKFFYGWYVVDPYVISGTTDEYGIGTTDSKLYYTWPAAPESVTFESQITITETDIAIGETVNWRINGVSGSGAVDDEGNVHVFLAPVFEKYNFINFMLYARDESYSGALNLMTRKLVALGSSTSVEVKISDIRSVSKDAVHLIFIGWEYNAGTDSVPNWVQIQTVDYSGAEMEDPGKDGVYLTVNLADTSSLDLYPVFIEARWVDYFSGVSGSGATYVPSTFRESWGTPGNPPEGMVESERNIFSSLPVPTRKGYTFEGWYAYATTDENTGEITNLSTSQDVSIDYISGNAGNYTPHTTTQNMTAVKIANGDGSIAYSGTYSITVGGDTIGLLSGENGKLKLYDAIDRLNLCANWTPDASQITVVYWTEDMQPEGYTAPANPKDDYTSSAAMTITTAQLNAQSSTIGTTFASDSQITLAQLQLYTDDSVPILDRNYLDDVGAVLSGEEKFYDLDTTLSDASVTIAGDGSTIFNVYFSRKTFKLVFHIGRDGYVKNSGNQKRTYDWAPYGNWIQYMYKDEALKAVLGRDGNGGASYQGSYSMTYLPTNQTYTANYVTTTANIMGDYLPGAGEDVYVLSAKYGAYIGDRWPIPGNPNFSFSDDPNNGKTLYIWAAYYGSLYCRIANERSNYGNENGNNPDINGVYNYMSAALCSNRAGDDIINPNQVHHLVAYYGNDNKEDRFKQYHIFYEAIDGTYDPSAVTLVSGSDYLLYEKTTWCAANGNDSSISGHYFYEISDSPRLIISNLTPEFQLGGEIDGLTKVYSCYNPDLQQNDEAGRKEYHLYYFYTPNQYTLSFMYENELKSDTYYYNQTLADANKYDPPEREGYSFTGWYENSAGEGDPFDFANERMPSESIILYPDLRVLQYSVKIDPNGGVTKNSMSTYFTANYGTTVYEYSIDRNYIMLSDREQDSNDPTYYAGTKYYYVNMQLLGESQEGDWGYPVALRYAAYVAEDQIDAYYNSYCSIIDNADTSWWTGIQKLSRDEFIAKYTTYPYRPVSGSEHYSFMGWYEVLSDGSTASMPFNFNEPVTGPLELRALWRLDGGYYIQYNPYFFTDDGNGNVIVIVGELEQWMDPKNPSEQLYADQSPTHILRAPTNTTADWVFRGWRVVKASGTSTYFNTETQQNETYTNWIPIQLDEHGEAIYYQPGESFTIDSSLVSENTSLGAVIHMQAYYEEEINTYRRPDITNLILDANDAYNGYVNTADSKSLPALSLPGHESINTTDHLDSNSHPTQILLGDLQSNLALHLYKYATAKTHNGEIGTNFFTHKDGYLLLGFDENEDPTNPTTGEAYIPAYASDSVVSVTRNETDKVLYAMWEPKVYVNFVNTTAGDITVELGGAAGSDAVRIVNIVTGEFDRVATNGTVTIPAKSGDENGTIIIVLPMANAGTDTFTASALNDHIRMEMSVEGEFRTTKPYGTASESVRYGGTLTYTGTLQTDATGVIVTYSEEPVNEVLYDVNGGTWNETSTDYELRVTDLYALPEDKTANGYEPTEPTRAGKIFVGWTTYADIAAQTDFSSTTAVTWGDTTITPDSDANILETIQNPEHDYLWDFSDEPPYDRTLYAVWSDTVIVTFDLIKSGTNKHTWNETNTVTVPENEKFYRQGNTSRYVTYTLMKGGKVPKPADPTNNDWLFMEWVTVSNYINTTTGWTTIEPYIYDFTQRITDEHTTLYTSWIHKNNFQTYIFTIQNEVVNPINANDEFTYTISAEDVELRSGNSYVTPTVPFGSITTQLKNNQTYTVRITISRETSNGTHNYTGYDVYVEVIDRSATVIKDEHILNYQGVNESRESYKYTIRVAQTEKAGYTTNVAADATGEAILTLDHDHFTFFSSTGNYYNPTTNAFTQRDNTSSTITFTNWRSADLTITKSVTNDLGDREHDFTFTLSGITNELTGSEYPYTKTRNGSSTRTGWLTTATGGNAFTLKHNESITISLPPNKDIVITENNGYYSTAWAKDDSNDSNVTLMNADTAAPTITLTGDSAITVTNTRGTRTVTVMKDVDATDTSGTFVFKATVTDRDIPFVGLNVYGSTVTDSNGQATFSLVHNGSQTLTIPYGAKLVVAEEVSVNYNPTAAMVNDDTQEEVTDGDEAEGSFTVNNLTMNGTITFTNTPTTDRSILFDVNGGIWTTSPSFDFVSGDIYAIKESSITGNAYKPNDPTSTDNTGKIDRIFIGWTKYEDLAAINNFSETDPIIIGTGDDALTLTPGADEILLDRVRSEALWDFSQEPPYGQTLYAVWSDAVTVTFNIAYTIDLEAATVNLHTWNGPDLTTTEAPYQYCNLDPKGRYITYTMAKGEKVPKPNDPSVYVENKTTGWNFIRWLKNESDVVTYRYNSKNITTDNNLTTYAFDFASRVKSDIILITSWTTSGIQTFTFTIRNEVTGGSDNEEFDYTIAVVDEQVYGKITGGRKKGSPDQKWGSIETTLKDKQEYQVVVTVACYSGWGGDYSVQIEVIDRNGIVIKSGHVIYCKDNTYKNYASNFEYTLSITQEEKNGYDSSIIIQELNGISEGYEKDDVTRLFTFYSCMSRPGESNGFPADKNGYVAGENNSLTVVFTNTCLSRNLIVTKTIEGTENTSDSFNFSAKVGDITDDVSYWWQKYTTTDGITYTKMTGTASTGTGTLTSSDNTIDFTLRHHQKIIIGGLPDNATVTVTENNGSYTASWQKGEASIQSTDGSGTSSVMVGLTEDTVLDVTNTKTEEETIVAPTGINTRHTPWLLLLLFGLMLLIGGVGVMKKRGEENLSADMASVNAVAETSVDHNINSSGRRNRETTKPPTPQKTMTSTTDAETRRQNSVCVNNAPNCGYDQRGYKPQIRDIPCPQAKLWQTDRGGGGAG